MPTDTTTATPFQRLIYDPVQGMWDKVLGYLPVLLGALVILILGWIVARIVKRLVDELLKAVKFDVLAEKAGIAAVLEKGEMKVTARDVVCGLVYWLIMIMVLVMTVNALGLPRASNILESVFSYVPRVIAALLALILGLFLASFVSSIVRLAAANSNMPNPDILAGICRWVIIVFAATVAITELDIATVLVTTTFSIILGGVVLAAALAVGLGSKDCIAKYLEDWRQKRAK
jgi:hypothetical protein